MTMTSKLEGRLTWLQKSAQNLSTSTVVDSAYLDFAVDLATGTAINTADIVWHDSTTLASGANRDIDLSSTSSCVRAIFGTNVATTFVKVKAIVIKNKTTTTGDELILDSSVANAFLGWCINATSKCQVGPNSLMVLSNLADGWAVTAGTGDILRITNTGTATISYDIAIIGTSA
jgi:hypothetical protein